MVGRHVQRLLTHKDPRMTQRYAHLRDETLKAAVNVVDEIVGDTVKGEESNDEKVG